MTLFSPEDGARLNHQPKLRRAVDCSRNICLQVPEHLGMWSRDDFPESEKFFSLTHTQTQWKGEENYLNHRRHQRACKHRHFPL